MSESEAIAICRDQLEMADESNLTMGAESPAGDGIQTDDMTETDDPDDATKWRQFKSWLVGGPDDGTHEMTVPEVPADGAAKALALAKEGRTLNSENREALMAAHDAIEAALASDLDEQTYRTNRFTDDSRFDFDVADYAKSVESDAPEGEISEHTMTDDDITDTVEALEQKVDDLTAKLDDLEDDGTEKNDEQTDETVEELKAELESQKAEVADLEERLDKVSNATADSQQLGGADEEQAQKNEVIDLENEVFGR